MGNITGYTYLGSTLIGYGGSGSVSPTDIKLGGGLSLAPGPMYCLRTGTSGNYQYEYGICDNWYVHNSYGITSGNVPGYDSDGYRTYFTMDDVASVFDSVGAFAQTRTISSIDNNGTMVEYGTDTSTGNPIIWRLPTYSELVGVIFGYQDGDAGMGAPARQGSTVTASGTTINNTYSVLIRVDKSINFAVSSTDSSTCYGVYGILVFPDNKTISTSANILNNSVFYSSKTALKSPSFGYYLVTKDAQALPPTKITESELDSLISQGCTFIPDCGRLFPDTSTVFWITLFCSYLQNNRSKPSSFYMTNQVQGNPNYGYNGGGLYFSYADDVYIPSYLDYGGGGFTPGQLLTSGLPVWLVTGTFTPIEETNYIVLSTYQGSGTVVEVGEDFDNSSDSLVYYRVGSTGKSKISGSWYSNYTVFSQMAGMMMNYTFTTPITLGSTYTYA